MASRPVSVSAPVKMSLVLDGANEAEIGRSIDDIDTPVLTIDIDVMDANIRRMVEMCRSHGVDWRPHSKAHKCPEIARRQIAAGALGVTCAKLGEAEVMAAGGVRDVLIANQIVGPHKMKRLAELCQVADPIVAVDHVDQVDPMSEAMNSADAQMRVIIEVDIGLHRAGVAPGAATIELAQYIDKKQGLAFAGIMGYEGHLLTIDDLDEKRTRIFEAIAVLVDTCQQLVDAGLACDIVSAGGTGSCLFTMECPGVTELQAGGLIFMDAFYRYRCQVDCFDHSLKVVTTVVGRPAKDRAIIDAGRKTHNAEIQNPIVSGRDDIRVTQLSAEHGQLELDATAQDLKIGDRLELIPGYGDFTCVLHNAFYAVRERQVEAIWPLAGRGKLR